MSSDIRGQRIRVAIFLLATTAMLLLVVFLLGRSESMFGRKARLRTTFENTSGLITGASVRLAGVDIGMVRSVHFDPDPAVKRVDVELAVGARYLDRIRSDSIAQINTKGLLGDMIINITIGSADKPQLKDGDHIDSAEAAGLTQVIESVQTAIGRVNVLATDVDGRLREVLTPELAADVGRIAHSSAKVIEGVEQGNGLAHKLVFEATLADDTGRIVKEIEPIVARINGSVTEVEQVLAQVRTGEGLLHGLVYEDSGKDTLSQLDQASKDLTEVVKQVQTGHGMLHALLYEEDKTNLVQNLSEAARIVRRLAEDTEQGKGTVGGLLKDPTVYQDLTTVLGNIKRNELLKALIRYTIVKDELSRSGKAATPAAEAQPPVAPREP